MELVELQWLAAGALAAGVVIDERQGARAGLALALVMLLDWVGSAMVIDALFLGGALISWGWLGVVAGAAIYASRRPWPEWDAAVLTFALLSLLLGGEWVKLAAAVVLLAAAGLVRLLRKRPLLSVAPGAD